MFCSENLDVNFIGYLRVYLCDFHFKGNIKKDRWCRCLSDWSFNILRILRSLYLQPNICTWISHTTKLFNVLIRTLSVSSLYSTDWITVFRRSRKKHCVPCVIQFYSSFCQWQWFLLDMVDQFIPLKSMNVLFALQCLFYKSLIGLVLGVLFVKIE